MTTETTPKQHHITDNLQQLLQALPRDVVQAIEAQPDQEDLLEIVLDLGRPPEARFPGRVLYLTERLVDATDIEYVTTRVGEFGKDNRAGIERTLHRISAIRNRSGRVVGLTCRIGRAVFGTIDIMRDVVETGKSILMLGRPGVGKTTKCREVARVLSEEFGKRVVIVDTSNEIAGDGDIPHPAIGRARRMQVALPELQHAVMIEAVENHMPEVIVIDEIGTEQESFAARTIAERGVQLVGTAHGNSLENLLMNPTLSDLVGGVQPVTLGDEEARRRGTQKTVLERKAPPTFEVLVEMRAREQVAVHRDVAETVDAALRGAPASVEVRQRRADGTLERRLEIPGSPGVQGRLGGDGRMGDARMGDERTLHVDRRRNGRRGRDRWTERYAPEVERGQALPSVPESALDEEEEPEDGGVPTGGDLSVTGCDRFRRRPGQSYKPAKLYPYGVNRDRLEAAVAALRLPVTITKDVRDSDVVMTLTNYYRKSPGPVRDAEDVGKPVFILRSNTISQIQQSLEALYGME